MTVAAGRLKRAASAICRSQVRISKRTAKDVKADMMKIYRDMGALKIVSKDNLIDKATYDKLQALK